MPLNRVEFGEELWQRGDADHDHAARASQLSEVCNGYTVVVQVLDHIKRQHGVIGFETIGERLCEIGLDQQPAGPIELIEGAS